MNEFEFDKDSFLGLRISIIYLGKESDMEEEERNSCTG